MRSYTFQLYKKHLFRFPHVRILCTYHCGKEHRGYFKFRRLSKYFMCCRDYLEQVVASFSHQIQSEYSVVNGCVCVCNRTPGCVV